MAPKRRRKPVDKKNNASHLPIMAPPTVIPEDQDWYRMASDILSVPGKYELEDFDEEEERADRLVWGNQLEFLMSCIATSVGLGNVWRFAFVAYQNGGGAFLIPYLVVLIFIGKPMYYLECILGQFSSRNSVRVWSCVPGLIGTGYAQTLCITYIVSYYAAIVALCIYYLVMSFRSPLPWSVCDPSWIDCKPSDPSIPHANIENATSSAELYFVKKVLQQSDGIEKGLGAPVWDLVLCLLVCWMIIFLIVAQGVKSSGKAAYFLAIFPYVVMIILLISTVILPGAGKGILFFITPQWNKLLHPDVWYAAVTQVFFSLSVGTGPIVMFSSYNSFTANVHRDSMIVTTLDTATSLLSGATIFGILGNLAHELKSEIEDVVGSGGTGLAFISYPDAISKTFMPQIFSILFFLMMVVLGMGSAVAFISTINTVFMDAFTKIRTIYITLATCFFGFLSGIVYLTPGGQYILELVDYYGATFLALFCAICEIVGIMWIYGLENLCLDVEFMLGQKTTMYWRICWGVITPCMMILVFTYAFFNFEALVFGGYYHYPDLATVFGYLLLFCGIVFVPIFMWLHMRKQKGEKCQERFKNSLKPKSTWGPRNRKDRKDWKEFRADALEYQHSMRKSMMQHIYFSLTGGYRKGVKPGRGGIDTDPSLVEIHKGKSEQSKVTESQTSSKSMPKSMARTVENFSDSTGHDSSQRGSRLLRATTSSGVSPPPGSPQQRGTPQTPRSPEHPGPPQPGSSPSSGTAPHPGSSQQSGTPPTPRPPDQPGAPQSPESPQPPDVPPPDTPPPPPPKK